ncbi:MAG: hypothetical protein U5K76_12340 [Woeseiaceae bacterium]|nr:hypothetical protein [Woeseiaceae bacterium]
MEDLVLSRVDYDLIDRAGSPTRIRLDSTAVDVRHVDGDKAVDVTYVRHGNAEGYAATPFLPATTVSCHMLRAAGGAGQGDQQGSQGAIGLYQRRLAQLAGLRELG